MRLGRDTDALLKALRKMDSTEDRLDWTGLEWNGTCRECVLESGVATRVHVGECFHCQVHGLLHWAFYVPKRHLRSFRQLEESEGAQKSPRTTAPALRVL